MVGGMPEAVQAFADTHSLIECDKIKQSILSTYGDDFNKYGRTTHLRRLQRVFQRLPYLVGGKFMYSKVDRGESVHYRLLSLPLYLVGQTRRLLTETI